MATQQSASSFVPQFKQPFTMEMALELDLNTLTNELARLAYSLEQLAATQVALQEVIDVDEQRGRADKDISEAYTENIEVIGSQRERIQMILIALESKGVSKQSLGHYIQLANTTPDPLATPSEEPVVSADGGIDL